MIKIVTGRVEGFSHKQRHQPCQDAFKVYREGDRAVIAVADGHGNEIHRYSADGSRIAVECAVDILREILGADDVRAAAEDKAAILPALIEREWKKRVHEFHYDLVEKNERPLVFDRESTKPNLDKDFSLDILYGTTLMAVLAEKDFLLALQIGDGDITYVDGKKGRGHVIESELQIGSATNSLCMVDSCQYFRVRIVDYKRDFDPVLVFLSTDGYSNSYRSDEDFLNLVSEYVEIMAKYEEADVAKAIEGWLTETSKLGSGDDITVGILYRGASPQQEKEVKQC